MKEESKLEIITLNKNNIKKEHICCAISKNDDCKVLSKKKWLLERFDEGLVFKKGNVRGKCFIEYIPAENAWAPVNASGYMYINCLWVSGRFKGQGNSNLLLDGCIKDSKSKGKKGLVILSSTKKKPFLADPKYLSYKGFKIADTLEPYYELFYLSFDKNTHKPSFNKSVKEHDINEEGFVLYYSDQCPFTAQYVPLVKNMAEEKGIKFKTVKFESAKQAQNSPAPFTSYSLFYNNRFITHEILSDKKFLKIIDSIITT